MQKKYKISWEQFTLIVMSFNEDPTEQVSCTSVPHLTQTDAVWNKGNFLTSSHSIPEPENSSPFESSNELQKISNAFFYGVIKTSK